MIDAVTDAVFPALLRYWRSSRGLSQIDLAGAADVSAKHISFLETGRAKPSRDMVLRLGGTLNIPLRDQNGLLNAAGFADVFRESGFSESIERALKRMMEQQEPYPLLVFDRQYELVLANQATNRFLTAILGTRADSEKNILKLLFDPDLLRPHVVAWEQVAKMLLGRLQRELLERRRDEGLTRLLSTLCAYEGVPPDWRTPDYALPCEPTLNLRFEFMGQTLGFLTTLTVFQAPQSISLEELLIESYFPLDDATAQICRNLAGD